MELIFILAIVFCEICLFHLFEVVEIVRAFGIDTLMNDKVPAVFLGHQSVPAMRTAQFHRGKAAFIGRESCIADLTEELSLRTVIFVQKELWCITAGTAAGVRNITFRAAADRADLLAIALFVVRDELLISPVLVEIGNQREFINLELLVLWGMGIIKGPLLKGDISANEVD